MGLCFQIRDKYPHRGIEPGTYCTKSKGLYQCTHLHLMYPFTAIKSIPYVHLSVFIQETILFLILSSLNQKR